MIFDNFNYDISKRIIFQNLKFLRQELHKKDTGAQIYNRLS